MTYTVERKLGSTVNTNSERNILTTNLPSALSSVQGARVESVGEFQDLFQGPCNSCNGS